VKASFLNFEPEPESETFILNFKSIPPPLHFHLYKERNNGNAQHWHHLPASQTVTLWSVLSCRSPTTRTVSSAQVSAHAASQRCSRRSSINHPCSTTKASTTTTTTRKRCPFHPHCVSHFTSLPLSSSRRNLHIPRSLECFPKNRFDTVGFINPLGQSLLGLKKTMALWPRSTKMPWSPARTLIQDRVPRLDSARIYPQLFDGVPLGTPANHSNMYRETASTSQIVQK
jgi:hypothetical protein